MVPRKLWGGQQFQLFFGFICIKLVQGGYEFFSLFSNRFLFQDHLCIANLDLRADGFPRLPVCLSSTHPLHEAER